MPQVSVIVVNYNCHTTLKACIHSILLSKNVGELVLVDNASTDRSLELIQDYTTDERLKIIPLKSNIGLAGARNLAVTKTNCEYLAFTDADSIVDPDWLGTPCSLLENYQTIGAVQCKMLSIKTPNLLSIAGTLVNGISWFKSPEKKLNFELILFPVGACIITRRDIWDIVSGFDSAFFVGHDDIDFGIRLWLRGYAVVCTSEGIVYHDGGNLRSSKGVAPIFHFYGGRNMLSIWAKDLEGRTLVKHVLPFSFFYPFQAFLHGGGITGIIGVISFLRTLPSILTKRQKIQAHRKISDNVLVPMLRDANFLPVQEFTDDFRTVLKFILRKTRSIKKLKTLSLKNVLICK
ncbi:MAG: glycosyltransferase family 2 protein [Candidatus Bathyarchaeota archaeon]|nr:glycosyltransferase family 2 protein [Candidatus Bathyarchaeota archaeon]